MEQSRQTYDYTYARYNSNDPLREYAAAFAESIEQLRQYASEKEQRANTMLSKQPSNPHWTNELTLAADINQLAKDLEKITNDYLFVDTPENRQTLLGVQNGQHAQAQFQAKLDSAKQTAASKYLLSHERYTKTVITRVANSPASKDSVVKKLLNQFLVFFGVAKKTQTDKTFQTIKKLDAKFSEENAKQSKLIEERKNFEPDEIKMVELNRKPNNMLGKSLANNVASFFKSTANKATKSKFYERGQAIKIKTMAAISTFILTPLYDFFSNLFA